MSNDELDRYLIITSDAHGGALMADYKPYLESRWHDEFDNWLAGVLNPWSDVNDTSNFDSATRLANMDADGVSGEIVFPNTLPPFFDIAAFLAGVPRDRDNFEHKWAGFRAHNRWLDDFCSQAPTRRRGIFQLLPNDIDVAVAEVRWAAETGHAAGVMLPAVPANHVVRPYFDERYDPLWAACAETGLAIHQHQGTGAPDAEPTAIGNTIFYSELDLWTIRTMHHLIMGGVFERHPQLQVVWTEFFGLRWALEALASMDMSLLFLQERSANGRTTPNIMVAKMFGSPTTDSLSLTPLEYFQRNCSIGASLLPRHEVKYIDALGVDRIMWGTDAPHQEGSAPYTTEALRATLHDVPVADVRAMLGLNAAALYGFDLDALTPIAARIGPRVDEVAQPLVDYPPHHGMAFITEGPLEALLS